MIRNATRQLIALAVTATLARLMTREEWGLVAAAFLVSGIVELVGDMGIAGSLVRRNKVNRRVLDSAFVLSLALGTIVLGIGVVAASPLARAVGQEGIEGLLLLSLVIVVVQLASGVPRAILYRQLKFRKLSVIAILGSIVYAITALVFAAPLRAGPWSIFIGKLAQALTELTLVTVLAAWRPRLRLNFEVLRDDLRFGAGWWLFQTTSYMRRNLDYWFVSRALGANALGIYYMAYVLPNVARTRVTSVASEVLFPVLSTIGQDNPSSQSVYLRALQLVTVLTVPPLAFLACVSKSAVIVLYGDQWLRAAVPMSLLCASAALNAVSSPATAVMPSLGLPGRNVRPVLLAIGVLLVGLPIAMRSQRTVSAHLPLVATVVLLSSVVLAGGLLIPVHRRLGLTTKAVVLSLSPLLLPVFPLVLGARLTAHYFAGNPAIALLLGGVIGASLYLSIGFTLSGNFRSTVLELIKLTAAGSPIEKWLRAHTN